MSRYRDTQIVKFRSYRLYIGTPFPQPPLPHYIMYNVVGRGVVVERGAYGQMECERILYLSGSWLDIRTFVTAITDVTDLNNHSLKFCAT